LYTIILSLVRKEKIKMKKILSFILCAVFVIGLCACGKTVEKPVTENPTVGAEATETPTTPPADTEPVEDTVKEALQNAIDAIASQIKNNQEGAEKAEEDIESQREEIMDRIEKILKEAEKNFAETEEKKNEIPDLNWDEIKEKIEQAMEEMEDMQDSITKTTENND
jgi:TolA-binding protein